MGGQILVNGYPRVQAAFNRVVGSCDQLEAYSIFMTVKEVVAFNAALNLEKTTTPEQRRKFVDEVNPPTLSQCSRGFCSMSGEVGLCT